MIYDGCLLHTQTEADPEGGGGGSISAAGTNLHPPLLWLTAAPCVGGFYAESEFRFITESSTAGGDALILPLGDPRRRSSAAAADKNTHESIWLWFNEDVRLLCLSEKSPLHLKGWWCWSNKGCETCSDVVVLLTSAALELIQKHECHFISHFQTSDSRAARARDEEKTNCRVKFQRVIISYNSNIKDKSTRV